MARMLIGWTLIFAVGFALTSLERFGIISAFWSGYLTGCSVTGVMGWIHLDVRGMRD